MQKPKPSDKCRRLRPIPYMPDTIEHKKHWRSEKLGMFTCSLRARMNLSAYFQKILGAEEELNSSLAHILA